MRIIFENWGGKATLKNLERIHVSTARRDKFDEVREDVAQEREWIRLVHGIDEILGAIFTFLAINRENGRGHGCDQKVGT